MQLPVSLPVKVRGEEGEDSSANNGIDVVKADANAQQSQPRGPKKTDRIKNPLTTLPSGELT